MSTLPLPEQPLRSVQYVQLETLVGPASAWLQVLRV